MACVAFLGAWLDFRRPLARVARERAGEDDGLLAVLPEVEEELARAVRDALAQASGLASRGVVIRASDRQEQDLGLHPDDLDLDRFPELCAKR